MKTVLMTLFFLFFTLGAHAAIYNKRSETQGQAQQPQSVATHAANVSAVCPGNWENETCLFAVSKSNYDMTVNYATTLDNSKKSDSLEGLKQVCAAASVTEPNIPAYAYTSAYTECANGIYDISEQTGVSPDQSHYQLIVAAVLCLSKDPRCIGLENQLRGY